MDETSRNPELESLLSLMVGDHQLMINMMADAIDTTAGIIKGSATGARTIARLVAELGEDSRAMIEVMADTIRRQEEGQRQMSFTDWLASEADLNDSLATFLLSATAREDWTELATFVEYRDYLSHAQMIDLPDTLSRFSSLWSAYLTEVEASTGWPDTTTSEYQYGVELRWADGTTERHPESRFGLSRYDAQTLVRMSPVDTRAVLQRRLSVHGPWVDVP